MENALAAREVLGLIALAATVIAAIANILVLPGTPSRRVLLATFFLASLAIAFYIFSQHQSRQKLEIQTAQRDLDERMRSMQHAEDVARRRIEQERESYESAVDEALERMREELKKKLEDRAKSIAAESMKTDQGFEELRHLIETREGIQRDDVRRFLTGSWRPKMRPPPQGIFNIKTMTLCDTNFAADGSLGMELWGRFGHGVYEIDEVQGDRVFIHTITPGIDQKPDQTYFIFIFDRKADQISIAQRGAPETLSVCKRSS
jgi:hypothetical protein